MFEDKNVDAIDPQNESKETMICLAVSGMDLQTVLRAMGDRDCLLFIRGMEGRKTLKGQYLCTVCARLSSAHSARQARVNAHSEDYRHSITPNRTQIGCILENTKTVCVCTSLECGFDLNHGNDTSVCRSTLKAHRFKHQLLSEEDKWMRCIHLCSGINLSADCI